MSILSDLVDLLQQSTDHGKIDWKLENDNRATTIINRKLVELLNVGGFAKISVRNSAGLELDSEMFATQTEYSKKVLDLLERIRRKNLGVDEALHDIIQSLQAHS